MADRPRRSIRGRLVRRLSGLVRRDPAVAVPAPQPRPPLAVSPVPPPTNGHTRRADAAGGRLWFGLQRRLDAIANAVTGFGTGDKITSTRPDTRVRPLVSQELTAEWRHGGYTNRYVRILPKDATRKGWIIKSDKEIVDTKDEEKRLRLRKRVRQADTWGRLYSDAWLWMVVTEKPDALGRQPPLSEPLDPANVLVLHNLVVLERSEVAVLRYESDPQNPDYQKPSLYWVTTSFGGLGGRRGQGANTHEVHASRMVSFVGMELPPQEFLRNGGYNDSVVQSVWAAIRNRESMDHGIGALIAEMRITTLKMRELAGIGVDAEEEYHATRMRMIAMEKALLNMVMLGDGEEYTHHPGTVAGMGEASAIVQNALQAQTAMPEQVWLGNAPGGLSTDGESHRRLWANEVSSYQTDNYTPPLTEIYTVMFAASEGPWEGVAPENWQIEYNPLDELTQQGKAQLRKTAVDADAVEILSGVLDPQFVARGRHGPQGSFDDLPPIEEATFESGPELDIGAILAGIEGFGGNGPTPDPADPNAPPPVSGEDGSREDRRRLAAHMTELGVSRCEHGRTNRCERCGVERRGREVLLAEDGSPQTDEEGREVWGITWAAIDDYGTDGEDTRAEQTLTLLDAVSRIARGRGMPGHGPLPVELRADAHEGVSVWIGLPLPEDALSTWRSQRLAASTSLGIELADLDTRGRAPHVTVLFVGKFPAEEAAAMGEMARVALDEALRVDSDGEPEHGTIALDGWGIGAFVPTAGSSGDTPVIMEIGGDALRSLNQVLSLELLDEEEREVRPWFQPHACLGYFDGELTSQQRGSLWQIPTPHETWQADTVQLNVGRETIATWTLRTRE